MPKETLIAIAAGLLSAFGATAFLTHVPGALVFAYLAALPLFMAGFALGPRAVALSCAAGFMATGLLGGSMAAGVFGMTMALPAWLMVRQLLLRHPLGSGTQRAAMAGDTSGEPVAWFPPGQVLCWLALLAAMVFAMVAAFGFGEGQSLSASVDNNLKAILSQVAPEMVTEQREMAVAIMAPLFPGFVGVAWMIMIIINATLGQNLLIKLRKNIRPTPTYIDLQLPNWVSLPLIAAAILALIGSGEIEYTGRNLAIILAVPFFFLGLSVVHTFVRKWRYPQLIFAVFYMLLLLSGWAVLAVTAIGAIEQWGGLRRQAEGPKGNGPNGPPDINH